MRVPSAIADYMILRVLRNSGGGAIAIKDDDMIHHMRLTAQLEGVVVGPEGGAVVAAARRLIEHGTLSQTDKILLINTGSGLKNLDLM